MAKLIKKNWQILPLILIWVALWRYYQGKTIDLMWLNTVLWHKVVQAKKFQRQLFLCMHRARNSVWTDWGVDRSTFCLAGEVDQSYSITLKMKYIKLSMLFSCFSCYQYVASCCVCGTLIWNPGWNSTRTVVYNSRIGHRSSRSSNHKIKNIYTFISLATTF